MIGRNGKRGSGISALAARHDDDDDDDIVDNIFTFNVQLLRSAQHEVVKSCGSISPKYVLIFPKFFI